MALERILEYLELPKEAIEEGQALFEVDGRLAVAMELTADAEHLRLRAVLGHTQDTGPSALTLEIAVANYAGANTGGGCLGLNPANGQLLLYAEMPCRTADAQQVRTAVTRFVDAALFWRERWQDGATPLATSPELPPHLASWVRA